MGIFYIPQPDSLVLYSVCGLDMPSTYSNPKTGIPNIDEKLTNHSTWTQCPNQNIKMEIEIKLTIHRILAAVSLSLHNHRTLKTGSVSVIR
jgi:hypothetical protein